MQVLARFSVVGPIPFLLAAVFFGGHPYIGNTTALHDYPDHHLLILVYHHILSIRDCRSDLYDCRDWGG